MPGGRVVGQSLAVARCRVGVFGGDTEASLFELVLEDEPHATPMTAQATTKVRMTLTIA